MCTTIGQALDVATSAKAHGRNGPRGKGLARAIALASTSAEMKTIAERAVDLADNGKADNAYNRGTDLCTSASEARAIEASAQARGRTKAASYAATKAVALGG